MSDEITVESVYTGLLADNPRGGARGTTFRGGPLGGRGGPLGGALRGGGSLGGAVRVGAPFDSVGEDFSINEAVYAKRANRENMSDKLGRKKRWMNVVME